MESLYPGVDVIVRQFDAGDEAAVKAVTEDAIARYGRLDIFFANAGVVGTNKVFTDVEGDAFMKTMRTNALGFVLVSCFLGWDRACGHANRRIGCS